MSFYDALAVGVLLLVIVLVARFPPLETVWLDGHDFSYQLPKVPNHTGFEVSADNADDAAVQFCGTILPTFGQCADPVRGKERPVAYLVE
ncbi:hypothetical protein DFH06DRAFT_1193824 [Mycena polygramma]|nr:hypothetical protein DFH06DRAFT_1193824 [Mycena polygramma]